MGTDAQEKINIRPGSRWPALCHDLAISTSRAVRALTFDKTLLFLLGLSVLISLICFTGYYASDDVSYLRTIKVLAEGGEYRPTLSAARLGLLFPAVPVAWLTGGNNFAIIFSFLLYHPVLVLLVYRMASRLHDRQTALLAALAAATCPLIFLYAGSILPDLAMTVWMTAALNMTLGFLSRREHYALHPGRAALVCMTAGLLAGLAYTVKQSGLLISVPCGVAIAMASPRLLSLRTIQNGAAFAAGLVIIFVVELLMFRWLAGAWVNRNAFLSSDAVAVELSQRMLTEGKYPLERMAYAWRVLRSDLGVFRYLYLASIPCYFVFFRSAAHRIVGFTTLWLFLYLTIGSVSFSQYLPPCLVDRYYVICIPTAVVALVAAVRHLMTLATERYRMPRRVGTLMALALVAAMFNQAQKTARAAGWQSRFTRAFVEAYTVARREYSALPLAVSRFDRTYWGPLFKNPNTHWAAEAVQPKVVAGLPRDLAVNEFLLLRKVGEWQDEFDAHNVMRLDFGPGAGATWIDPADFVVEPLYLTGFESNLGEQLSGFRTKFLMDLKATTARPGSDNGALQVLELWRRKPSQIESPALFSETHCRGPWMTAAPPRAFANRQVALDRTTRLVRAELRLFGERPDSPPPHPLSRLPVADGPLTLRLPLTTGGEAVKYTVWFEVWGEGGLHQRVTDSGELAGTKTIELPSTQSFRAARFRVGLDFELPAGAAEARIRVAPIEIFAPKTR